MTENEFKENIELINKRFKANLVAIKHKNKKMFIMPVSLFVEPNRDGLVVVWNTIKSMVKKGYRFEQPKE